MAERLVPGVGDAFGGYTIESVLGRGGMGAVYLATHERLERRAALKVIAPELAHDGAFRARFLRESRLAASLDHPHVIPIYDAGEADGVLYLAMRYVDGPTLQTLLRARGTLPPADVVRLAEQVGGALDAAHEAGLVHRDVKPANILLAESGGHAYLADFGLAKPAGGEGVTRTGSFVGTADYCAPEQVDGREVDGRADLYALGAVLFHCLAGVPPFRRESEFAVLEAHLRELPPALSSVRPGLPPGVDGVLAAALAKAPGERYGTGRDLSAALGAALAGVDAGATQAAPAEPSTRPAAPGRRPGRRLLLAVAAAALLVVAAVAGVLLATRGPSSSSRADAQLRSFVDRIENVLAQSADGRREIVAALGGGFRCSLAPAEASRRIGSVADNRESVLLQLGSLATPTSRADTAVTRLQRALQLSIEADRHYRDAFAAARGCPVQRNADFAAARAFDRRATPAKRSFLAAFNPLAARFGRRTWTTAEI